MIKNVIFNMQGIIVQNHEQAKEELKQLLAL